MEKKEEYVVHVTRSSYLLRIIMSFAMEYLFYRIFILDANNSVFEYRNVTYIRLISLVGMALFFVCFIVLVIMFLGLRKNNGLIFLNQSKIKICYNHPILGVLTEIAWEEITDIDRRRKQNDDWVMDIYYIDKNIVGLDKKKRGKEVVFTNDGIIYRASVLLAYIDKEPEEVINKIFEYWENYKQQTKQHVEPVETIKTETDILLEKPKTEIVEENELNLMEGLLEAADDKKCNELQQSIKIKRNGKILFDFNICSLSREEINKLGEKYIGKEYSLQKIYLATIDKEKIWDNEQIQSQLRKKGFSISTGIDMIQAVLEESEIKEINAKIDQISGIHAFEISKANE